MSGREGASITGGNYSLQSRLRTVRGRLDEINCKVRNLESNMIFLLVNPHLVIYKNEESQGNQQFTEPLTEGEQPQVMTVQQVDFGQEQYILDPSELNGLLSDNLGTRHELMVAESEILHALYDEKKKDPNDSDNYDDENYCKQEYDKY